MHDNRDIITALLAAAMLWLLLFAVGAQCVATAEARRPRRGVVNAGAERSTWTTAKLPPASSSYASNYSLELLDSGHRAEVVDSASMTVTGGEYTICFTYEYLSRAANGYVFNMGFTEVKMGGNEDLIFYAYVTCNGVSSFVNMTPRPVMGGYNTICYAYDDDVGTTMNDAITIYMDGVERAFTGGTAADRNVIDCPQDLEFNSRANAYNYEDLRLAHWQLFDRAFNGAELATYSSGPTDGCADNDILLQYTFGDTPGDTYQTIIESCGSGDNLTVLNAAVDAIKEVTVPAATTNTTSVRTDGVDEYLTTPDHANLDFTDAMSVCFWHQNAYTIWFTDDTIIAKWAASQHSWRVETAANTSLGFYVASSLTDVGSNYVYETANNISDAFMWVHHCIVYDAGTITWYKGGVARTVGDGLTKQGTIPASIQNSTAPVTIGANGDAAELLNAYFDELALWNVALTAAQVAQVFNQGQPLTLSEQSPAPVACWPVDGSTHPTISDACGSHDMTMTNMEAGDIVSTEAP